jgi:hypothetical protein
MDGRPIFIAPIPRGVKEYSHDDLETIPGTSFILKKNSRYPPPPTCKGTAISSEMCICELGIHFKVCFALQVFCGDEQTTQNLVYCIGNVDYLIFCP